MGRLFRTLVLAVIWISVLSVTGLASPQSAPFPGESRDLGIGSGATAGPGAGPTIRDITTNTSDYPNGQIPRYEKFEITFQVDTVAENLQLPYDPAPPPGIRPGLNIALFHVAAPYPGTPFFYEVVENQWFRPGTNWEEVDMDQSTVLDYPGLRAEQLEYWQKRATREWALRPGPIWTFLKGLNTWEGVKSAVSVGVQTLKFVRS